MHFSSYKKCLFYLIDCCNNDISLKAVVIVKALDHDSGSNADISYQITAGNEEGTFSIDSR